MAISSSSQRSRKPVVARRASKPQSEGWLGNLPIWQKLLLLSLALGIPLIVVSLAFFNTRREAVLRLQDNLQAIAYVQEIQNFSQAINQHALATNQALSVPSDANTQGATESTQQVSQSLNTLKTEMQPYLGQALIDRIDANWQAVQDAYKAGDITANNEAHLAFFLTMPDIFSTVANQTGLNNQAEQHLQFLAKLGAEGTPNLKAQIDNLDAVTRQILQKEELSEQDRINIAQATALAANAFTAAQADEALREGSHHETEVSQGVEAKIPGLANDVAVAMRRVVGTANLMRINLSTANANELAAYVTQARQSITNYQSAVLQSLSDSLNAEVQVQRRNQLLVLALVAILLLLATWLVYIIARSITQPVSRLFDASQRLGSGDLTTRVNVHSRDELGALASAFNNTASELEIKARADAETLENSRMLQAHISDFLDVAMDIAEGDFTKRGTVSEDVLGNVIDAINLMVEEVASLLQGVSDAVGSVTNGADDMISTTTAIAESSRIQTATAQEARNEVLRVTDSIRQIAANADTSAEAATRTLAASQQGEQAVTNTLEGMQGIRREVQAISRRIKSLGERSLEIYEIVETISRISSQTNLLALNAAIEAAGAGEAGGRFAIVADEVRKLAEDSAQATRNIASLIKNIQLEVQEVTTSVESGTREVEEGYRVASETGERLREISQIATRSAELARSISQSTQQQVPRVEQVGNAVTSMAQITETSNQRAVQSRQAAEQLQELAQELSDNLGRFRLA